MTVNLRTTAAALLAGTGLLLAGCSSSDDSTTDALTQSSAQATASVEQARKTSANKSSAKFKGTVTTINKESGTSTTNMNGAFDEKANSLKAKITKGVSIAELVYDVIHIDGTSYVKAPALNSLLGDKWIKIDLSSLGLADPLDPEQDLNHIKDYTDLQDAGPDVVNGQSTTKYVGTVNVNEALKDASVTATKTKADGKGHAQVAVWVDDNGLILQQETLIKTHVDGVPETVDTLIQFSNWGKKVKIKAPPASDTLDIAAMISPDALGLGDINIDSVTGLLSNVDPAQIKAMVGGDEELLNKIKGQLPDSINLDDPSAIVPDLEKKITDKNAS